MADPVMLAVATAVAGKAAETLTERAGATAAAIVHRIKAKFSGQPAALATLEAAQQDPARAGELATLLDAAAAQDPDFASEIHALWQGDILQNNFHGKAKTVVQLRDVHGDLHIG